MDADTIRENWLRRFKGKSVLRRRGRSDKGIIRHLEAHGYTVNDDDLPMIRIKLGETVPCMAVGCENRFVPAYGRRYCGPECAAKPTVCATCDTRIQRYSYQCKSCTAKWRHSVGSLRSVSDHLQRQIGTQNQKSRNLRN